MHALTALENVPRTSAPERVVGEPEYSVNEALEIVPLGESRFELRLPLSGAHVEATRYQLELLLQFADGSSIDAMLRRFPFERESCAPFLEECRAQSLLLLRGPDGVSRLPATVRAHQPMFAAPHFDAVMPPAFAFLGVPWDGGTGARFGPSEIRVASEACRYTLDPATLSPRGFFDVSTGRQYLEHVTFADAGDVRVAPGDEMHTVHDRTTQSVRSILDVGTIPLVLGGDRSISHSALRAYPERPLRLVHLGAHPDGAHPDRRFEPGSVFEWILRDLPHVESITQIGARGHVEGGAAQAVDRITTIGMGQFRDSSIEDILARLPGDGLYYLSIGIDVVDPSFAPATARPAPSGMLPRELIDFTRALATERVIIGCDVSEVTRAERRKDQTAHIATDTLLAVTEGIAARVGREIASEEE